jgi:hypothetical protein
VVTIRTTVETIRIITAAAAASSTYSARF